jgi:hypothetical protein
MGCGPPRTAIEFTPGFSWEAMRSLSKKAVTRQSPCPHRTCEDDLTHLGKKAAVINDGADQLPRFWPRIQKRSNADTDFGNGNTAGIGSLARSAPGHGK